jgi:hypothetical protein
MPFYDEFDLSTVDVLLISQYVFAHLAFCGSLGLGAPLESYLACAGGTTIQQLVYQYQQWNIICILPVRLR